MAHIKIDTRGLFLFFGAIYIFKKKVSIILLRKFSKSSFLLCETPQVLVHNYLSLFN